MKKFYVLWTYVANYSRLIPITATSAEEAIKETCGFFSKEFLEKATVYVFDREPVLLQYKGTTMTVAQYREASKETR